MRILMISTDFPYKSKDGTIIQGGGSACIAQLVEGLLKKNVELAVVTRAEKNIDQELFKIPIYRTRFLYLGFRESKITHSLFSLPTAIKAIKEFNPDVIHSHNPPAALTGIACAKLFHKPHFLTMHGPWSEVRIKGIKKTIAEKIERFVLKHVDIITCDSIALKNQLEHKYKIKAVAIQNAVDKNYYSKIQKSNARSLLNIKTRDKIILFTGRFVAEKGLDTLLTAASNLLNRRKDITLLLIGGGFDEKIVHGWLGRNRNYKNKILTIPFLRHELMKTAYCASDVFVLPSLAEGLSRSLMEAMLFGLPSIATAVGGNMELLENNRGILVKSKDSKELAQAISKVLADREIANKIAKNGRSYVINNLTVEKRISKFITSYNRIKTQDRKLKTGD
ncbi:glycosyltransferase family 4 protein [Candidatus Micrarchaeota archaeon]|nr:glycosyltransferase family 4 protein [Candidatus Micrarchaeota archaeon]